MCALTVDCAPSDCKDFGEEARSRVDTCAFFIVMLPCSCTISPTYLRYRHILHQIVENYPRCGYFFRNYNIILHYCYPTSYAHILLTTTESIPYKAWDGKQLPERPYMLHEV